MYRRIVTNSYSFSLTLFFIGARSEALASALLELHGLQDMLDKLWGWVSEAETTIKETEQVPIGNNLETVEQQLTEHEVGMWYLRIMSVSKGWFVGFVNV